MRDIRFISELRGGILNREQHRLLMVWACECAEHVLPFLNKKLDERIEHALKIAGEWIKGNATVGDTRKASLGAIAVANEMSDRVYVAAARSVGHAVATAHMADHCLAAALYALKAVKHAGRSATLERDWQNEQLPEPIRDIVLYGRLQKEKNLKL